MYSTLSRDGKGQCLPYSDIWHCNDCHLQHLARRQRAIDFKQNARSVSVMVHRERKVIIAGRNGSLPFQSKAPPYFMHEIDLHVATDYGLFIIYLLCPADVTLFYIRIFPSLQAGTHQHI